MHPPDRPREPAPGRWSEARAEGQLRSLELFGMRFGLDRMRRMMTVLGSPEQAFDAIQVLGTNGKSSTTRMTAAILQRHGLRTGAYLSPHLLAYRERILIDGRELEADAFAQAVEMSTRAAERVNRTLSEDDHVTQFELLTAAAIWQMAQEGVEVAVVEAGLGGRYDATSVVPAGVTVLTNVGLEHTRWLGPTVTDIAEEKLAVVRPGGILVLGEDLVDPALAVAERVAAEREATILRPQPLSGEVRLAARGPFQRRNFALARAAAEAHLARRGMTLQEAAVAQAGARDGGPRAPAAGRRGPADGPRRRTQPRRSSCPGRGAAGGDRAGSARARDGGARGQGRRGDAADPARPRRARLVHRSPQRARPLSCGASDGSAAPGLRGRLLRAAPGPGAGPGPRVGPGARWRGARDRVGVPGR